MTNTTAIISVVVMLGWLVLVGSALKSRQLGWSKGVQLGLAWVAIFLGLFLIARLAGLTF